MAGLRLLRHRVDDLVQVVADGNLARHLGDRVAGRLRRQRRRTAHPRIYLNDIVFRAVRVEGILHIAAAFDAQGADNIQRRRPQHLVLVVGQRLRRRHHDAVARVDAHRVEILHIADRDAGVVRVPHHLVLDLLPAGHAPLHQHLADGAVLQAADDDIAELGLVARDAAARAAQRIRRADYEREADPGRERLRARQVLADRALRHRLADLLHRLLEQFAVLGLADSLQRRPQQLHAVPLKHAALRHLHRHIQAHLAAQRRQQPVRPLLVDHLGHELRSYRLDIHPVGDIRVRHDRRRVGIYQHHLEALVLEGAASLGAGVVELGRLADHDRPRTDDHNFLQIRLLRHPQPSFRSSSRYSSNRYVLSSGPGAASGWYCTEKIGKCLCFIPSIVPSFTARWVTI